MRPIASLPYTLGEIRGLMVRLQSWKLWRDKLVIVMLDEFAGEIWCLYGLLRETVGYSKMFGVV